MVCIRQVHLIFRYFLLFSPNSNTFYLSSPMFYCVIYLNIRILSNAHYTLNREKKNVKRMPRHFLFVCTDVVFSCAVFFSSRLTVFGENARRIFYAAIIYAHQNIIYFFLNYIAKKKRNSYKGIFKTRIFSTAYNFHLVFFIEKSSFYDTFCNCSVCLR